ncbi:hypothetical protein [Methanolapillus ohkumae]|uniref:Transglutaminase domain-containing protein n=1 Tax=Methanolapillus ohkumae TaxID=3028298 RepID=A0AA96V7J0_9EURY|nr:hypothetical protein MsAm2_04450 [Methanosarcinaceae archaeon Am2]
MGKASKMIFLLLFVIVLAVLVFYAAPFFESGTNKIPFPDLNSSSSSNPAGPVSPDKINDPERVNYFNNQKDEPGYYTRTYTWKYDNQTWNYTISIPIETYDLYRNKSHVRADYSQYALSQDDREILGQMTHAFQAQGEQYNYTDDQTVGNIIAFIQSMPYSSDSVTTGFDSYPRYPVETLVDGGGDCEDSTILAAALLHELGYDTALLGFTGHMALGVAGMDDMPTDAVSFERNGKYYYVETTSSDYAIGEMPAGVDAGSIHIYKMNIGANLEVMVSRELVEKGETSAIHEVIVTIKNRGPNPAENITVEMNGLFSKSSKMSDEQNIGTIGVNETRKVTSTFTVARGQWVEFRGTVYGSNFETVDLILTPFEQE